MEMTPAFKESLSKMPFGSLVRDEHKFYKGAGCKKCNKSGFAGRICINEVLVADDEIREAILVKKSASEIRNIAIKNGMTTMLQDGFMKVLAGETTVEEILRVIHE